MLFPRVRSEFGCRGRGYASALRWSDSAKGAMDAIGVVVDPEMIHLAREVERVPKEHAIEVLSSDRTDEALNERMRDWRIRDRLDLLDLEHA